MKNSWNSWLSTFSVAERRYTETTLERYSHDMRVMCAPVSRRPAAIANWKFSAVLLTAVSAATAGDVRYLVCVERIQ